MSQTWKCDHKRKSWYCEIFVNHVLEKFEVCESCKELFKEHFEYRLIQEVKLK